MIPIVIGIIFPSLPIIKMALFLQKSACW